MRRTEESIRAAHAAQWQEETDVSAEWLIVMSQFRFENECGEIVFAFFQHDGRGLRGLEPFELYVTHSDVDWQVMRTKKLGTWPHDLDGVVFPWILSPAEQNWLRAVIMSARSWVPEEFCHG